MRMFCSQTSRQAPLFWRVFGLNTLVFVVAGLVFAVRPLTVSWPITLAQATTLVPGIAVMLLVNLALMSPFFAPRSNLASTMREIDPLKPGQRVLLPTQDRELSELVASLNEMLDRLETERRASAHREAKATDAGQRRIAGELHDEIGQRLTVLLLMLANAQADADPEMSSRLQDARDLAHEILDDLKDVVRRLRPAALDELGIVNALTALLQLLHASIRGRFRTRGRYAAASVRGTRWATANRCDGTLIRVQSHTIRVTDSVKHISRLILAGDSYLAKPPR
jgi:two-component system sensor histidine kinase UhpB